MVRVQSYPISYQCTKLVDSIFILLILPSPRVFWCKKLHDKGAILDGLPREVSKAPFWALGVGRCSGGLRCRLFEAIFVPRFLRAMASISRETLALQNSITSAAIIEAFLGKWKVGGGWVFWRCLSFWRRSNLFEYELSNSAECRVQ